jgi:hypothetical protein
MKENIRRLVLFAVIVGTGSILILVDIPLIYLIPLIVVVGFILLVLLGSITVADIKNAVSKLSFKNLRQLPVLKKLDSLELSGKKSATRKDGGENKLDKKAPVKPAGNASGIRYHLSLLASSVTSFGKILTERKKPAKKPEEINKLLEHTITEKVTRGSALDSASTVPEASGSTRGGAGGALPAGNKDETDPFLSLSDEDLGTGLLDGLDEPEPAAGSQITLTQAESDPGLSMPDLEMPALPDEMAADADAILKANADPGSDELNGLDGVEAVDETLGDLDSINLDDIDLGDDSVTQDPTPPAPLPSAAGPAPGSGSLIPATPITLAGGSENSADDDQADMSSFAAGTATGSDEDMLSSLASDIKHVKKEQDVSLLRELKDFKAPATDIEKELQEMSDQLTASTGAMKKILPTKGRK